MNLNVWITHVYLNFNEFLLRVYIVNKKFFKLPSKDLTTLSHGWIILYVIKLLFNSVRKKTPCMSGILWLQLMLFKLVNFGANLSRIQISRSRLLLETFLLAVLWDFIIGSVVRLYYWQFCETLLVLWVFISVVNFYWCCESLLVLWVIIISHLLQ